MISALFAPLVLPRMPTWVKAIAITVGIQSEFAELLEIGQPGDCSGCSGNRRPRGRDHLP
jgi:hypothetical protein